MLSGRARLACHAAAASLLTACSLLPLVWPASWLLQALPLVAAQAGAGALARRARLPRPVIAPVQALVSLELLTLVFARSRAAGGLLPGPAVLARLGGLVTDGVRDVGQYAIPAPVTPGIRLLLLGGVLLVALAVDALAVTYGSAAPAGLPLLALYSFAAGLSGTGVRRPWFLTSACGYLLLLLAEGRDRTAGRERMAGQGRVSGAPAPAGAGRSAAFRPGPAGAPLRTGRRIGALALGVALLAPAVLPSPRGGLLGAAGRDAGPGQGSGTISAVNPVVELRNQLDQPDNREVLRYRTDGGDASRTYLRLVALDRFDGTAWTPSKRVLGDVPAALPPPPGLSSSVRARRFVTTISADRDYAQMWLPLPYPAESVRIGGQWRFEPAGRAVIGDRGQTTRGMAYTVTALDVLPTARQLASAPKPAAAFLAEYTGLPGSLPPVVRETALEVTAGRRTDYARAVALQQWFTSGAFTYSTSVASGTGVQAITRFLADKRGFCVHFAFTMATMARALGIPARVAVGFAPGTPRADGTYSVGLRDAHAWPELYFEGVGWTRFEPTPTRGVSPDYTLGGSASPDDGAADPPAARGGTARPSATPVSPCHAPGPVGDGGDGGAWCATVGGNTGGGPAGGGSGTAARLGFALLALPALVLPALPALLRRRVRRRRLASGDPLAAWQELIDTGWDYGVPPDATETPRRAVARLVRQGRLVSEGGPAAGGIPAAAPVGVTGAGAGGVAGAASGSGAGTAVAGAGAGAGSGAGAGTASVAGAAAGSGAGTAVAGVTDTGAADGAGTGAGGVVDTAAGAVAGTGGVDGAGTGEDGVAGSGVGQADAGGRSAAAREAAQAAHRVASAVERALYAPRPGPAAGVPDDVRRVRAGLRAAASPGTRVRALVLPRSSVRVLWRAADRRRAATARWSATVARGVARLRRT